MKILYYNIVVLLVCICFSCVKKSDSYEDTVLYSLADTFMDTYRNEFDRHDKSYFEDCPECHIKSVVFIEADGEYKGYPLFTMYIGNVKNAKSKVYYKNTDLANLTNEAIGCCKMYINDEISWNILIDSVNKRYIAVNTTLWPLEIIKQFNELQWSTSVTDAIVDTFVKFLPPPPPSPYCNDSPQK